MRLHPLQATAGTILALALAFQAYLYRTRGFLVAVPSLDLVLRVRLHLLRAFAGITLVLVLPLRVCLYKTRAFVVAVLAPALVL